MQAHVISWDLPPILDQFAFEVWTPWYRFILEQFLEVAACGKPTQVQFGKNVILWVERHVGAKEESDLKRVVETVLWTKRRPHSLFPRASWREEVEEGGTGRRWF